MGAPQARAERGILTPATLAHTVALRWGDLEASTLHAKHSTDPHSRPQMGGQEGQEQMLQVSRLVRVQ